MNPIVGGAKGKKKAPSKKGPKKVNPWLAYVAEVKKKNPKLSHKEALELAAKSYKKK